jgi:uncharacterized membrane protein YfcA
MAAGWLVGMMRAGFGGGVGVVAAPLLALVMPAKMTLGVIAPLVWVTDVISVRYYWRRWETRTVVTIVPGCILGVAGGWFLLDVIPEDVFRRLLGGLACVFALLQPIRERLGTMMSSPGRLGGTLIGMVTGLASTMLHSGGVVLMLYLVPQNLPGRRFVATAFLVGVILNVFKLVPYLDLGLINRETLALDLRMLPALGLGALSGILLNQRLSVVWFNRVVLGIVLVVGGRLMFG